MESPAQPPPPETEGATVHALSVDVEDWFQAPMWHRFAPRFQWDDYPLRVEDNVHRLLDLFDEKGVRATFFVPGCLARRSRHLVVEICERGHELGCRGFWLRPLDELGPRGFREDASEATRLLEDASGRPVAGFRAPEGSVVETTLWAFDALEQLGYLYDASVHPYARGRHGFPGFPRRATVVSRRESERGNGLIEFPHASVRWCGATFPGPSGGYLRVLTGAYCRWALRRSARVDGEPSQVSVCAWEVDPEPPRMPGSFLERRRQRAGLRRVESRLSGLLDRFAFAPVGTVLEQRPPRGAWRPPKSARPNATAVAPATAAEVGR